MIEKYEQDTSQTPLNHEAWRDEDSYKEHMRRVLQWKEWFRRKFNRNNTSHKRGGLAVITPKELFWIIFVKTSDYSESLTIATWRTITPFTETRSKLIQTRAIPTIYGIDISILNRSKLYNDANFTDLLTLEIYQSEEYEEARYE